MTSDETRIPPMALALGLGGAIPFAALAFAVATDQPRLMGLDALFALIAYGATILSFLGGIRWGLAVETRPGEGQAGNLALSVVPSLAGWVALLLPSLPGLALLLAGVLLMGAADLAMVRAGHAPAWYGRLRLLLTAIVGLSLFVAFGGLVLG
jgi:hypothetical protein